MRHFIIRSFLLPFVLLLCGAHCFAHDEINMALEPVKVNSHDQASIMRGAKFFAKNCMVCHTMRYLEYNSVAEKAGITLDKMPLKQKEWWRNVIPPDLTLMARQRSPEWLYTYLHSFYKDPSRPTGYNNLLAKDVNMMNVLVPYQGEQELLNDKKMPSEKLGGQPHYYSLVKFVKAGSMTPEEFDATITDLVNFLVYASEPAKAEREKMGVWVILFLIVLAGFAYFLKKSYWKNVK